MALENGFRHVKCNFAMLQVCSSTVTAIAFHIFMIPTLSTSGCSLCATVLLHMCAYALSWSRGIVDHFTSFWLKVQSRTPSSPAAASIRRICARPLCPAARLGSFCVRSFGGNMKARSAALCSATWALALLCVGALYGPIPYTK